MKTKIKTTRHTIHKIENIAPIEKAAIEINRQEHSADSNIWDVFKHLFMWKESPKDRIQS